MAFSKERLKAFLDKHPDLVDKEEDVLYEEMAKNFDSKNEELKNLRGKTNTLLDLLDKEPELIDFLEMFVKHPDNPALALKTIMSEDDIKNLAEHYNDEVDFDALDEQTKAYYERKNADKARKKEIDDNVALLPETISAYAKTKGVPEDVIMGLLSDYSEDLSKGKMNESFLDLMWRGKHYDEDIEKARTEGRNEQIKESSKKAQMKDDGLPKTSSSAIAEREDRGNPFAFMGQ